MVDAIYAKVQEASQTSAKVSVGKDSICIDLLVWDQLLKLTTTELHLLFKAALVHKILLVTTMTPSGLILTRTHFIIDTFFAHGHSFSQLDGAIDALVLNLFNGLFFIDLI